MSIFLFFLALLPGVMEFTAEFPYEPPKILLLLIGSVACLIIGSWYFFKAGRLSAWVARLNRLDLAVALLFVALALSSILSVNPAASFFGTYERSTGLLFYASLTLVYFALRTWAKDADWRIFAVTTSFVAGLIAVYGILQWFGIDLSYLHHAFPIYGRSGPTRAFSTLGHPNFLGAYLAMALPICLVVWKESRRRSFRYVAILSALLAICAVGLTYSRGAWLAAVAAILVYVVLGKLRSRRWYFGFAALIGVLALTVALGLFTFRPFLMRSSNSFLYRVGATADFSQGSTLARVAEWKYAAELIPRRPILGYGIDTYENYSILRVKNENERNRDYAVPDPSIADRLHNIFFDVLWAAGLAGLMLFIAVCILAAQRLSQQLKHSGSRSWVAAVAGALAAYLVAGLTGFDFSLSGLWFYLILAALAADRREKSS
ncbi:MAG: O-antigen ligase family protein [Patescibacteria group bacterium]